MLKLYRSSNDLNHWVAYVPEQGWVIFPAREGGWEMRRPARGLDPMYLREVSPVLGATAGIPLPSEPAPVAAAASQPARAATRRERRKAA